MTIPATGPFSAWDLNNEVGRATNTQFDMSDQNVRSIAQIMSGTISASDFRGKAFFRVDSLTNASGSVITTVSGMVSVTVRAVSESVLVPVTTNSVTVNFTGGTGPFTYAWEYVSGNEMDWPAITLVSSQPNIFTFRRDARVDTSVNGSGSLVLSAVYRCKITDANGHVAYSSNLNIGTTHIVAYDPTYH